MLLKQCLWKAQLLLFLVQFNGGSQFSLQGNVWRKEAYSVETINTVAILKQYF